MSRPALKWLVNPEEWLETGTAVAVASCGGDRFDVLVSGPGVLGKLLCEAGSTISPGQPIAVMHADGESIPYGKPYPVSFQTFGDRA